MVAPSRMYGIAPAEVSAPWRAHDDLSMKQEFMQNNPIIDIHCHGAGIGAGKQRLPRSETFAKELEVFVITSKPLTSHLSNWSEKVDMLVMRCLSEQLNGITFGG